MSVKSDIIVHNGEIFIRNLNFNTILGMLPFERTQKQPVLLSVRLQYPFTEIAEEESLSKAVNYAVLSEELKNFIQKSKFQLVETLVFKTAKLILNKYAVVQSVEVSIAKPKAIPNAQNTIASIKMER